MREFGRLAWSPHLDRHIRQDEVDILGISTLTLIERSGRAGHLDHADALADYYWAEVRLIGLAPYTRIDDIVRFEGRLTNWADWPLGMGLTCSASG
jgi:hypothetical protein